MNNTAIKWLKKAAFGLMVPPLFIAAMLTAHADSFPEVEIDDYSLEGEYIVNYCLEAPSYVTTGIYKAEGEDSSKRVDILEEKVLKQEGCYSLYWDGKHGQESQLNDRPERAKEGKYFYGVTAKSVENQSQGKDYVAEWFRVGKKEKEEELEIEDFDVDNTTFNPEDGEEAEFTFELNKDAYVTLIIRDEDNDTVRELLDEKKIEGGEEYEIDWDGEDDDDDLVPDGEYTYKLIVKSSEEREIEKGDLEVKTEEDNTSKTYKTHQYNATYCSVFNDVYDHYARCEAIEWAYNAGVLRGYSDGSFRPERSISRAEALKMVMEALDIKQYEAGNLYFSDVSSNDWYASYLKTAISLNLVSGYSDGTFKPNREVSRVEALVMLLNAAQLKDGITLATSQQGAYLDTPYVEDTKWYYSYARFAQAYNLTDNEYFLYPAQAMTRGEMADMLYRYSQM